MSDSDTKEIGTALERAGIQLTPAELAGIVPGVAIMRAMIARVNAPLPREAEPAVIFRTEQG